MDALSYMLSQEQGNADVFVFLGDIFGYFYDQGNIINRLRKLPNLYSVKGNHDKYYVDGLKDSELKNKLVADYGDSYNYKAGVEELEYINNMADYLELSIDGKKLAFFHGGPEDFLEQRIYPDSEPKLGGYEDKYDYIFMGHTHYKMIRNCGKATIANPGSLGQPRDILYHNIDFSYCTFDTLTGGMAFKNAEIGIEKLLIEVNKRDCNSKNGRYLLHKYGGLT